MTCGCWPAIVSSARLREIPSRIFFALITFGGGFGGRSSLVTTLFLIYMVAIMSAVSVPAINAAMKRAHEVQRQRQMQQPEFYETTP